MEGRQCRLESHISISSCFSGTSFKRKLHEKLEKIRKVEMQAWAAILTDPDLDWLKLINSPLDAKLMSWK